MKVSIITVCFNAEKTILDTLQSVSQQSYKDIEHIIIDGGSMDNTRAIVNEKAHPRLTHFMSEPDHGIYDAMNKGIALASGDVIGTLNADDVYKDTEVLKKVVATLKEYGCDACFGDLVYVSKKNPAKIIRLWKSSPYKKGKFRKGWMPPHPTFFFMKEIYEQYGYFNTKLKIASDYEIMLRFIEKHGISTCYIPEILVKMRMGGKSNRNLFNILHSNVESYKAWKINDLPINPLTFILKPLSKIPQFFMKPISLTSPSHQ